jgi:hypothetical protein
MSTTCEAGQQFQNAELWPPCRRPADTLVRFTYADVPYVVRACEPCSVLFTVHKPSLHATAEPLVRA